MKSPLLSTQKYLPGMNTHLYLQRCRTRKMACIAPSATTTDDTQSNATNMYLQSPEQSYSSSDSPPAEVQKPPPHLEPMPPAGTLSHQDLRFTIVKSDGIGHKLADDPETIVPSQDQMSDLPSEIFPYFFEQRMMPPTDGSIPKQNLTVPPDVSNFVQDMDFSLDDFNFQFQEPFAASDFFPSNLDLGYQQGNTDSSSSSTLALRANAFQSSPWYVLLSSVQYKLISSGSGYLHKSMKAGLNKHKTST